MQSAYKGAREEGHTHLRFEVLKMRIENSPAAALHSQSGFGRQEAQARSEVLETRWRRVLVNYCDI